MSQALKDAITEVFGVAPMTEQQKLAWERGEGVVVPYGGEPHEFHLVQLLPVWWTNMHQDGRAGTYGGWEWESQVGPIWCEGTALDADSGKKTYFAWWPPDELLERAEYV